MTEQQTAQEAKLEYARGPHSIAFELSESDYPLEVVNAACYRLVARCFVFLSRSKPQVIDVQLTARGAATTADLESLAGDFAAALIAQTSRHRLSQATARIREYYTAAALRAAAAAVSIDDLLAELDAEELLEDPLDLMVPWEAKDGSEEGAEGAAENPQDGKDDEDR